MSTNMGVRRAMEGLSGEQAEIAVVMLDCYDAGFSSPRDILAEVRRMMPQAADDDITVAARVLEARIRSAPAAAPAVTPKRHLASLLMPKLKLSFRR